jgi:hypothetical protein
MIHWDPLGLRLNLISSQAFPKPWMQLGTPDNTLHIFLLTTLIVPCQLLSFSLECTLCVGRAEFVSAPCTAPGIWQATSTYLLAKQVKWKLIDSGQNRGHCLPMPINDHSFLHLTFISTPRVFLTSCWDGGREMQGRTRQMWPLSSGIL